MGARLPIVLLAAWLAMPALAQPAPQTGNVPTVTRLVKLFSDLERSLVDKARAKDASDLDALLDASFEMRVGSAPGAPVPRDAWIRETRKSGAAPRIEQMAVHDFGDVAVVSFRESAAAGTARNRGRDRFVVDCWKRDGSGWKLAARYLSDASATGIAPGSETTDKRY